MSQEPGKAVFISYSWSDGDLAVRLADSLSLYAVPVFLDRREIKVGDSVPQRVFEGLGAATHVVYLISKQSLVSRWVQEELAIAKTRQLSKKGCKILPVLVENVKLPPELSHIRYADLRNWKNREAYIEGLRQLLEAIELTLSGSAEPAELRAFRSCIPSLLRLRAFAESWGQLCFQLERLWFKLFDPDYWVLCSWVDETVCKSPSLANWGSHWDAIAGTFDGVSAPRPQFAELESRCRQVRADFEDLSVGAEAGEFRKSVKEGTVTRHIFGAERRAYQLSAILMSILVGTKEAKDQA